MLGPGLAMSHHVEKYVLQWVTDKNIEKLLTQGHQVHPPLQ